MGLYVLLALTLLIALSRRYLPQVHLERRRAHVARAAIASLIWVIVVASTLSLGMFMVLGAPFVILAPFGGGWLACRVVRPERRLIMRLGWGVLLGTVFFFIATNMIFSSAGADKIRKLGDYGVFVWAAVALFITSWFGALIVSGSSSDQSAT